MNTSKHNIIVNDIEVQIIRKRIKNLHLAVYPPDGHVRVSVPLHISDENVRLAVISRINWIRKQQAHFQEQVRQSKREMVSSESHYLWGKRYRLEVAEHQGKHEIKVKNNSWLNLTVQPGTSTARRELVLNEFYRAELKKVIPGLLEKWEPVLNEKVNDWGIKKMKTRWGSCTIEERRIWINLELAKKPPECLEYILVHEMVHLKERHHNENFRTYMDDFFPNWRLVRDLLNSAPLAHEEWHY